MLFSSYLKDLEGIFVQTLVKGNHTFVPLVEFVLRQKDEAKESGLVKTSLDDIEPCAIHVVRGGTLRPAMVYFDVWEGGTVCGEGEVGQGIMDVQGTRDEREGGGKEDGRRQGEGA